MMDLPFYDEGFSKIDVEREDKAKCIGVFRLEPLQQMIEDGILSNEDDSVLTDKAASFMGVEKAEIVQTLVAGSFGCDVAVLYFAPQEKIA
jgi:hypothetical protein